MKIAFTGPSGSGKTTLAEWLQRELLEKREVEVPFISQSAYGIIPEEKRQLWERLFGYTGSGHRNVIKLGSQYPEFAIDFQKTLIENRLKLFRDTPSFIADRSTIDNMAYTIDQVAHLMNDSTFYPHWDELCGKAMEGLAELDYLIVVRVNDQPKVENNGSRVDNLIYQRKMSSIFELAIKIVPDSFWYSPKAPRVIILPLWDLEHRKNCIRSVMGLPPYTPNLEIDFPL